MIPPICEYFNRLCKEFGFDHAWEWLTDHYEVRKVGNNLLINGEEYYYTTMLIKKNGEPISI